jgi:hypothetical protein
MAFQKAYCSQNEFNELFLTDVNNDILEKIITDFCDIYMDIEEAEIIVLSSENPIFKRLLKRDSGTIISAINEFESIRSNSFFPFLNDILILNKEANTEAIRNDYGILAIKTNDVDYLESLDYHFGFSFNEESKFHSWEAVFKNPIHPINSAILIDNFLWGKLENFNEDNVENFYVIFEKLIPKTLKVPFYLSIIISNKDNRLNPKNAQEKINKVSSNLKKITGIDIEISITTQTNTDVFHERVILTNHHYIYSHKGFTVFKNNKVINQTNGDRNWVYKDIKNYEGEIKKHFHYKLIRNIIKQIDFNNKTSTNTIFNLGNTNNPLLN